MKMMLLLLLILGNSMEIFFDSIGILVTHSQLNCGCFQFFVDAFVRNMRVSTSCIIMHAQHMFIKISYYCSGSGLLLLSLGFFAFYAFINCKIKTNC